MATIEDRVKHLIAEELGLDEGDVGDLNKNLQSDLGMDELDVVELIMSCEEEFQVAITDEEADHVATINDLVELIRKKLA